MRHVQQLTSEKEQLLREKDQAVREKKELQSAISRGQEEVQQLRQQVSDSGHHRTMVTLISISCQS